MNNKVAVIIPVYRKEPGDTEKMSLSQCFKVLGNHSIIFFAVCRSTVRITKISLSHTAYYFESICSLINFLKVKKLIIHYVYQKNFMQVFQNMNTYLFIS